MHIEMMHKCSSRGSRIDLTLLNPASLKNSIQEEYSSCVVISLTLVVWLSYLLISSLRVYITCWYNE